MRYARSSIILAAMLAVAGCNSASQPSATETAKQAPVSRADSRLPAGFEIYVGTQGDVREFSVMSPKTGGSIATYSVRAKPEDVVAFYEKAATAKGMELAGRVSAQDFYNFDARKAGATPHSFGAVAVGKGEYTNVSLSFDVTP